MPFNIKSWEQLSEGQLVPLCKPNVLAEDKEITSKSKEWQLRRENRYPKARTLELFWEYFLAGYQCYCFSKKAWRSERDYLLNLESFCFCFKDLKNLELKNPKKLKYSNYLLIENSMT